MTDRTDHIEIRPPGEGVEGGPHIVKVAGNGEVTLTSEPYDDHAGAVRAAEREAEQAGGIPVLDLTQP